VTIHHLFDLTGRVAIVTGACGLLGREHSAVLAEAGAHVVVTDLHGDACRVQAEATAAQHGTKTLGVQTDVSDQSSVESMVNQVLDEFGHIDILVNNAAMTAKGASDLPTSYFAPFEEYPLALWEKAVQVNLTGSFMCSQAVGRHFLRVNSGVIVNISSMYALVGPDQRFYRGIANPYQPDCPFNTPPSYSATKAAILGLTRYLATYWAGKNIRVNALTLGGVREQHDEDFVSKYASRVPLGRMAERHEYRGALLFLASDASSYMTGANLVVDGGWTAW
jgi:NAD(P)-dependent dehydrogenase (short-subunit alcohol dehydrogenase family)